MSRTKAMPHPRVGAKATGSAIGLVVCLVAAGVMHVLVAGDETGLFAWPATLATAIFVGIMGGMMFGAIVAGGRADDLATRSAREAIARAREANGDADASSRAGGPKRTDVSA